MTTVGLCCYRPGRDDLTGTTPRLTVLEWSCIYDVDQGTVLIIQVLSKQDSLDYLGGSS